MMIMLHESSLLTLRTGNAATDRPRPRFIIFGPPDNSDDGYRMDDTILIIGVDEDY